VFSLYSYADVVLISESDSDSEDDDINISTVVPVSAREELEKDRADIVEEYQSMFNFKNNFLIL
jgi:hypothetical protein